MSPFTLKDMLDKYNLLENEVQFFMMTKSFMDNHPSDNDSNFRNVYFGNSRFTTAEWLSIVPKKLYSCKYVFLCFNIGRNEWVLEGLYEVRGEPKENHNPDRSNGEARWTYKKMKRMDEHDVFSKLSLQITFVYKKSQSYVLNGKTVSPSPVYILPTKIDFSPIFDKQPKEESLDSEPDVIFSKIAERYIFFVENDDNQALRESRQWMSADSMDKIITIGKSEKWSEESSRREHIVPCTLIHKKLIALAKEKKTEEMIDVISTYLKIVLISQDESNHIDYGLKLKTEMPNGWDWGDDRMARLKEGEVKLIGELT